MLRALALLVIAALAGCDTTRASKRYTRDEVASTLKRLEVVSLELGEFPIDGSSSVLDGDTIRVKGLTSTLRLLGIDTEETFKHAEEKELFAAGWDQYKKKLRGSSPRPVKMATPLGEDAKTWAMSFFDDVHTVRLERDHPGEIRDYYGRYLAYVLVKKNDQWLNYNVECVRAGFSPYFMKYGRSRRFHREFVEAQKEAQDNQRGVWKPGAMHYDDYDERLRWWGERELVITHFEKDALEHPDTWLALTRWDALLKLEALTGKEVVVLGSVSEVKFGEKGPSVVKLSRTRLNDFDVVFFDKDVLVSSGLQFKKGEFVRIKGIVQKYRDPRGAERLQLVVTLPGQVLAPSSALEKLIHEDDAKRAGSPKDEEE